MIQKESSIYMGRYTVLGSGADCKSAVNDSPGSNPGRPTREGENLSC